MKIYYLDCYPKSNGYHTFHNQDCDVILNFINRKFLGHFITIKKGITEAQKNIF